MTANGSDPAAPDAPDFLDAAVAAAEASERRAAPEPALAGPRIVLAFAGPGSADMVFSAPGVSVAQLYAAAFYLDCLARQTFEGVTARQALAPAIPDPAAFLDALRRQGRV